MDKICVVFTGTQYYSWFDNNIIKNLSKTYEIEVVILNSNQHLDGVLNFPYSANLSSMKSIYLLNQITDLNLSKSFRFRLRRMYLGSINLSGKNLSIVEKIKGFFLILKTFAGYNRINFVQILALVGLLRKYLEIYYLKKFKLELVKVQNSDNNFLKKIKSEIVIFPTSGADLMAFELLELCKLEKKKSLFVIENWDNLTSKTTFPFMPDFITVMGKVSAIQAQEIHGFSKSSIAVTGLPRFERYSKREEIISSGSTKSNSVKILYLGFSLPYNERTICNTIVRHLQNNYALSKFEVHYRPHPARQKRFKEEMITLKSPRGQTLVTVWEDQMQYQKNLPLINNEYLSFLLDFDIVIATPTTMALEVMMLGIPCIIDSGDDGIHITSPWYAMTHYLHLEDLFSIPELRIAKSELEICNHLDALIKSKKNLQKYSLQNIIEFQNPFSTNLVEFLKSICFKLSYKP